MHLKLKPSGLKTQEKKMGLYGINFSIYELSTILLLNGIETQMAKSYTDREKSVCYIPTWDEKDSSVVGLILPEKPEKEKFLWGKQEFNVEKFMWRIYEDVRCGCDSCCHNILEAIRDNGGDTNNPVSRKMQEYIDSRRRARERWKN